MKKSEKREIERFQELVKYKEYKQISDSLKTLKDITEASSDSKINLLIEDFKKHKEILKILLRNDIKFLLCNKKVITQEKIDVIVLLGKEYSDEMRSLILENLLKKYFKEYIKVLEKSFTSLTSVEQCIEWFEATLEKIKMGYSQFPESWNIEGEMIFRFCMHTKQKICDVLFNSSIVVRDYLSGLNAVMDFERKYTRRKFSNLCCSLPNKIYKKENYNAKAIVFDSGNINLISDSSVITNISIIDRLEEVKISTHMKSYENNFFCDHKKMLSRAFLPYIDIYVKDIFEYIENIELRQDINEMKIISSFIYFFKEMGKIFSKVAYFNDTSAFLVMIQECDKYLSFLITKIDKRKDLQSNIIILNTLSYIRITLSDLLEKINEKQSKQYSNLNVFDIIRKAEKIVCTVIEDHLKKYFSKLHLNKNEPKFAHFIFNYFELNIFSNDLYLIYDEVLNLLLETTFSFLFSRILMVQMDINRAEMILFEISELKNMFRNNINSFPFLCLIERYLKIFLCSPNDTEEFISNFVNLSGNTFSFSQILKMLADKGNNINLFVIYKKNNQVNNTDIPKKCLENEKKISEI